MPKALIKKSSRIIRDVHHPPALLLLHTHTHHTPLPPPLVHPFHFKVDKEPE